MKKNEKCLKKAINYQLKKAAEISNSIFISFKKLYFDMKTNSKKLNDLENSNLSHESSKKSVIDRLLDTNLIRFKRFKFFVFH